jgi:hypothetical protein
MTLGLVQEVPTSPPSGQRARCSEAQKSSIEGHAADGFLRESFAPMIATADGLFPWRVSFACLMSLRKIDRSFPIVAETEQIANGRNSCLKSRAQIFDGSEAETKRPSDRAHKAPAAPIRAKI